MGAKRRGNRVQNHVAHHGKHVAGTHHRHKAMVRVPHVGQLGSTVQAHTHLAVAALGSWKFT